MTNIGKKIVILICGLIFGYMPLSQAVFCTGYRFEHPETGNSLTFLADVHFDIDLEFHLTRIQQYDLIEAAKKNDALVITESDIRNHINYFPFLIHAIKSAFLAFSIKKKTHVVSAWLLGELLYGLFEHYKIYKKNTKPSYSFDEYMQQYESSTCISLDIYPSSPLAHLVQNCQSKDVKVISCEFRYFSHEALFEGDLKQASWFENVDYRLNQGYALLYGKLFSNSFFFPRTLTDYVFTIDTIIAECLLDSGNCVINDFCKQCVETYLESPITRALRQQKLENPSKSLATLIPDLVLKTGSNNQEVLYTFRTHTSELLNAYMMQAIYKHRDAKNIIICAGAAHIEELMKVIEDLGYRLMQRLGWSSKFILNHLHGDVICIEDINHFAIDVKKLFTDLDMST